MPDPVMVANATLTPALPKKGLLVPEAHIATGELYLADIGVPPTALERAGLRARVVFSGDDLLRIG